MEMYLTLLLQLHHISFIFLRAHLTQSDHGIQGHEIMDHPHHQLQVVPKWVLRTHTHIHTQADTQTLLKQIEVERLQ